MLAIHTLQGEYFATGVLQTDLILCISPEVMTVIAQTEINPDLRHFELPDGLLRIWLLEIDYVKSTTHLLITNASRTLQDTYEQVRSELSRFELYALHDPITQSMHPEIRNCDLGEVYYVSNYAASAYCCVMMSRLR